MCAGLVRGSKIWSVYYRDLPNFGWAISCISDGLKQVFQEICPVPMIRVNVRSCHPAWLTSGPLEIGYYIDGLIHKYTYHWFVAPHCINTDDGDRAGLWNIGIYLLFIQLILWEQFNAPVYKLRLIQLNCWDKNYCSDIFGLLICVCTWWLLCVPPSAVFHWSEYNFPFIHINFHCFFCCQRVLPVGH
jgi:hypothetical protein